MIRGHINISKKGAVSFEISTPKEYSPDQIQAALKGITPWLHGFQLSLTKLAYC